MKSGNWKAGLLVTAVSLLAALSFVSSLQANDGEEKEGYGLVESLTDLKQSAHDIIKNNRRLEKKIENFMTRIPELRGEFERIKDDKNALVTEGRNLKGKLSLEAKETGLIKKRIDQIDVKFQEMQKLREKDDQKAEQKRELRKQLQSEVNEMRSDLNAMRKEIAALKEYKRDDTFKKERDRLNRLLAEGKESLGKMQKELARVEKEQAAPNRELSLLEIRNKGLKERKAISEAAFETVNIEEKQIKDDFNRFQKRENKRLDEVTEDINSLALYKQELMKLIDSAFNTFEFLKTRFNEERNMYLKTIANLKEEKEELQNQEKLVNDSIVLQQQYVDALIRERDDKARVNQSKSKIDSKLASQQELMQAVEEKKERQQILKIQLSAMQREVDRLSRSAKSKKQKKVRSRSSSNTRILEQKMKKQQDRVAKANSELVRARKEEALTKNDLVTLKNRRESMKQEITKLNMELESMGGVREQIQVDELRRQAQQEKDAEQLDIDIQELELYSKELENLFSIVNEQFDADTLVVDEVRGQTAQIKEQVSTLTSQNAYLRDEMENLIAALEYLQSEGEKN